MIDVHELSKNIKEILSENERLQYTKKRYIEIANDINDIIIQINTINDKLKGIAHQLDPVIKIKVNSSTNRSARLNRITEIKSELMQKMRDGVHITAELIRTTYKDDLEEWDSGNIMQWLKLQPDVKKAKDGIKVRLFI